MSPDMVYVLPAPVCPYAMMVTFWPANTSVTASLAHACRGRQAEVLVSLPQQEGSRERPKQNLHSLWEACLVCLFLSQSIENSVKVVLRRIQGSATHILRQYPGTSTIRFHSCRESCNRFCSLRTRT